LATGEKVVVSAVTSRVSGSGTISVQERGACGSTAAIQADASAIVIIGAAGIEGNVDVKSVITNKLERKNHFQLFLDQASVSVTSNNQGDRSMSVSALANARVETFERVRLLLERALIYGGRQSRIDDTTSGTLGGLDYFFQNTTGANITDAGGAFTEAILETSLQEVAARGGDVDTLICHPKLKAQFNSLNKNNTRYVRTETVTGVIVNTYASEIGDIRIIASKNVPLGKAFIVNTKKLGKMWFKNDALRFVDEPDNSRRHTETLQGQMSFKMKDITVHHALIEGITFA